MDVNRQSDLISLPVTPESIFRFPDGLPAFEEAKEFVFMIKADTNPFLFMQALELPALGFVCVDPFSICEDYKPKISDADIDFLRLSSPEHLLLLSIITVAPDARNTTANLQGPLAINLQNRTGKQVICEGQHYPVRYRIMEALERMGRNGTPKRSGKIARLSLQPV